MTRRLAMVLMLLSAVAFARPASAQSAAPDAADPSALAISEELIQRGIEARKRSDDQGALEYFQKAAAARASPRLTAQIGLAEYALGLWVNAEEHLKAALATDDLWVTKNRPVLETAVANVGSHLGTLEVSSNVIGAILLVDGQAKGTLPLEQPIRIATGTYSVELRHPRFYEASRRVKIAEGSTSRETIALEPRVEPAQPKRPRASRPPKRIADKRAARPDNDRETRFGIAKWAAAGSGTALLAGAGVTALIREHQVSSYNEDSTCPGTSRSTQSETCDTRIARANALRTLSLVALTGGLVLGAISGALFLTDKPKQPAVACGGGPRILGISCEGRF